MKDNQKSFSDAWRNPRFVKDGPAFNRDPHAAPVPVSQETKDAARARNQQVIQNAKSNLGRIDSQPRIDAQHDSWLAYVNDKLRGLEDC